MDLGHVMPLCAHIGNGPRLHDPQAFHVAWPPSHGLMATRVLTHHNHANERSLGAATDLARWCIWGVIPPALGVCRHVFRRVARPAVVGQGAAKNRRFGVWPALLAYVILSQFHQRSLRMLAASKAATPHFATVIGLHALAFLTTALILGRGTVSIPRRKRRVLFIVLITEVLSWEALGRLGAHGHIALSVALFSGFMLPWCMAASWLLLGQRFKPFAWVGAVMVAVGVGCCTLGNPLTRIASKAEVGLLVAACCFPCLSLVGKEALMSGRRPLSIPIVGLLVCVAQLIAVARPHTWPPMLAAPSWASASAWHMELAALSHRGPLLYVMVSGLLRVSILVFIWNSSASTLQLVNALAVPLVATILTSGLQQNVQALLLGLGGAAMYAFGQRQKKAKALFRPVSDTVRRRRTFMDEVRQANKDLREEQRKEEKQERQRERLGRLQRRWTLHEKRQQEIEQQQQKQQQQQLQQQMLHLAALTA